MRRESRGLVPELFDWLEAPLAALRPVTGQPIRFEDYVKEGRYVLRAELPGIDPEKDLEITVANGVLTIHAERRHEERHAYRTEFRYGAFTRSIPLPPNADERNIKATYDQGILEVVVQLTAEEEEGRRIRVERPGGQAQLGEQQVRQPGEMAEETAEFAERPAEETEFAGGPAEESAELGEEPAEASAEYGERPADQSGSQPGMSS
ncbi:Hsp20/alpha crystallin family protein [Planotetraspora sp. GP83]|uniref:Hsp20/alpha crystallin family protein n=1 Tax=Planotetraspora sp. GP83 TaxID=3156264 RepID=UPI003516DA4C